MAARPRRRRRTSPKLRFRRWRRRQDRFTRGLGLAAAVLAVLVVALVGLRMDEESLGRKTAGEAAPGGRSIKLPARRALPSRVQVARPPRKAAAPPSMPLRQEPAARARAAPAGPGRFTSPRVAIVIDDLGQRFSHFEQLAGLNIPLTIAVIPGLPASDRTASEAARHGIEVLLHQPMEPHGEGGKDPGAGVLLTSMTFSALRAQVRANIAAVPGAVGVNNHMGSRFTEDAAGLGALMAEIKEHGLFWLDSRTTPGTRGIEMAKAAGVPALARDFFIDAEVNDEAIRRQVRRLVEAARTRGTAVGIGHPHPETLAVLRELRAELLASGVALVHVSTLVRGNPASVPEPAIAATLSGQDGMAGRKSGTP